MSPDRLRHLASSLRGMGGGRDVDEVLQLVADLAVDVVPGVQLAGVMFIRAGQVTTPVSTDVLAAELDQLQRDAGEGPCIVALRHREVAVSHDLAQEDRWPSFTSRALDLGIRSVAAYRLFRHGSDEDDQYGALNMFGTDPGFDRDALDLAEVLAASCSVGLAGAIEEEGAEVALLAREVIGQAKGILMVRHGITPDEAYAMLRRASEEHGIEVSVVASQVVAGNATLR